MSDHLLVKALSTLLDTYKLETGLLLVPMGDELRLIGWGIGTAELIAISRSLNTHINQMLEVPTPARLN